MTTLRLRPVALCLGLVAGGFAIHGLAASRPQADPARFYGTADLVSLNVTVIDTNSHFVKGLDRQDFQVLEDGVPQELVNFTHDPQPIALSILIDTSTSMERKLPIAQEAAVGFVQRLGPHDVAQIMGFDSGANTLQDFTSDRAALEQAIRRTQVGGSTALYTAVYTALDPRMRARARSADESRRQAIVVLSDGDDTSSVIDYDQVMEAAKRSGVILYTIGLRSKDDAPPHGFNEADFVLRTLAQETGARTYRVEDVAQLAGIYQQIADELANQYSMGYISKNLKHDGAWRRILVKINRPATGARTKTGYFAPTGPR